MTDLLKRIDGRSALVAAIVLYLTITGWGILNDGFHSDDWRHLNGTSALWTAVEGRWLLEIIYRDLLGERFLLPVQLALAFPCLWWVARTLSRHAAPPDAEPACALAIFAIGTNHIYMSDALSFGSNVFAYPLALALSVGAFELLWRVRTRFIGMQVLAGAGAAQLLAFSLAIYQTFAVAGLILPVLALVRFDRVSFSAAVRFALIGAVASVLAIALYLGEWRLYAAARGVEIAAERFAVTEASHIGQKLAALPALLRSVHTGALMTVPRALRHLTGLFALSTLALLVVGWASEGRRGGALGGLRIAVAAGLAFFVFPIGFWLGYEGEAPPGRAFGYIGFWIAAIAVAGLALLAGGTGWRRLLIGAGATGLGLVASVFAMSSAAFWSDNARLGALDMELARAIRARLATLPGYDGPPFRLVGTAGHPDLSWGSIAGWTSFHAGNPNIGIFRVMFGDAVETQVLPASPRACSAFPSDRSVFLHDGIAYVCLEEMPAVTETLDCAPLSNGGQICLGPHVFAHIAPDCLVTARGEPELRVLFHYDGSPSRERSFTVASAAVRMEDGCYTLALAPRPDGLAALAVRLVGADGEPIWEEQVGLSALKPLR
jgi:hypothetical protein